MPVRLTGMISGMDTETMIKGIVDAQKLKNKKVEDKQTTLTWKQEKWKDLNSKLYKLYTEDLSKMRLQGNYKTKTVSSTNANLVEATGNTTAAAGEHTIAIKTLASSQYVTGGKLAATVTSSTLLKDTLGMASSAGNNAVISINNGDKERNLVISDTTTVSDFVNACKEVGLSASYDKTQQRMFISSQISGEANKFTITTGEITTTGAGYLNDIKSAVNFSKLSSTAQSTVSAEIVSLDDKVIADSLYDTVMDADPKTALKGANAAEQEIIDSLVVLRDYAIKKAEGQVNTDAVNQVKNDIKASLIAEHGDADSVILDDLETIITKQIDAGKLTVPVGKTKEEYAEEKAQSTFATYAADDKTKALNSIIDKEYNSTTPLLNLDGTVEKDADGNVITKAIDYKNQVTAIYNANIVSIKDNALTGLVDSLKLYKANNTITASTGTSNLTKLGLDEITGAAHTAATVNDYTVVKASDALVNLDGADLTSSSNTISANGLTITAKGVTAVGEKISLSVANNAQAAYDMVKNFVKSYNDIIKEMNSLYYADSTRGYDPLTDEEKEAMTDDQIEKWETKIKGSVLRRDSTLGSLLSTMKQSMSSTITVGTKKLSLANYGIQTSVDYTEKGLLHIHGNKDDSVYSARSDKLMKALEENPGEVIDVLSGVAMNLYDTMTDKMEAIPNVRSALTFYSDKTLVNQQKEYTKKIAIQESKLTAMENKYYKQFAAMESAMAKLQSQSSALTGLLGTSM